MLFSLLSLLALSTVVFASEVDIYLGDGVTSDQAIVGDGAARRISFNDETGNYNQAFKLDINGVGTPSVSFSNSLSLPSTWSGHANTYPS